MMSIYDNAQTQFFERPGSFLWFMYDVFLSVYFHSFCQTQTQKCLSCNLLGFLFYQTGHIAFFLYFLAEQHSEASPANANVRDCVSEFQDWSRRVCHQYLLPCAQLLHFYDVS